MPLRLAYSCCAAANVEPWKGTARARTSFDVVSPIDYDGDVSFEEALRSHLLELEHAAFPQRPPLQRSIDSGAVRRHFLNRLREREDEQPDWVEQAHRTWAPVLDGFVRYMLPCAEGLADDEAARELACLVLDAALGCLEPSTPLVDRLELERLAAGFESRNHDVDTYALETRLTHLEPRGVVRLSSLGRTFLRLRGRDAVRWLLTVEVLQSRGDDDQWRVGRGLLWRIFETGVHIVLERSSFSPMTMDRLAELGVISAWHGEPLLDDLFHGVLAEDMREVVGAVLEVGPWHAAVAALLEDERGSLLQPPGTKATEATIEQTRMIAHEVRNALGPVRYNIDELLSEGLDPQHRSQIKAARRGVLRVLAFVDQLVSTSELITEPSTTFEVDNLLREALGWLDGAERVQLALPECHLRLRAPRSRLLRALLDVIRNALQSATPAPPVRISASRGDRDVRIVVDDGGPGIPSELRTRVFDDGFTTRPGGSGFGLAFLRQVVERELHGRVSCEGADLGGARFTITIPDPETEP
jgi:signal transduction histidine kinase